LDKWPSAIRVRASAASSRVSFFFLPGTGRSFRAQS
jgi:hypothetical protein